MIPAEISGSTSDETLLAHATISGLNSTDQVGFMNTISKGLVSTVIYGSDAHIVLEELRERFDKVNASRASYLHKEIVTLPQGTTSVSTNFSRLRAL
ncbi:hypothetical protein KY289_036467 [Solanum tuberosum]|nr:hypothetical protein KY289_036467 [Solanum tuberosum]